MVDKPQLLIVEDDLDLSEMLNAYFRVQNYEVLTAAWGEEALKITRDNDVDLIVLDIRLPDIDGYEVCRKLREQRRTHDTPIIFLTEKRDRVDKLQGLELGVVDYVTKPFDIQELRLRVRNAISRANRQTLVNPVTDLPEGPMVKERLATLVSSQDKWALLRLSISSLDSFREMYGFVAADDVMRAVTLMVRNAVREHGTPEDYVGQLADNDFVVISKTENILRIKERVEARVGQSREYFYPLKDRDKAREAMEANHLRLVTSIIMHDKGPFGDVDDLIAGLSSGTPTVTAAPDPVPAQAESTAPAPTDAAPAEAASSEPPAAPESPSTTPSKPIPTVVVGETDTEETTAASPAVDAAGEDTTAPSAPVSSSKSDD